MFLDKVFDLLQASIIAKCFVVHRTGLARIMHRFSSRSDESTDLSARPASGYPPRARAPVCGSAPANVLYGTLRRPTKRNTGGAQRTPDDFVAAVENLCIVRAKYHADH